MSISVGQSVQSGQASWQAPPRAGCIRAVSGCASRSTGLPGRAKAAPESVVAARAAANATPAMRSLWKGLHPLFGNRLIWHPPTGEAENSPSPTTPVVNQAYLTMVIANNFLTRSILVRVLRKEIMSQHSQAKRISAPDIAARKGGSPIVSLTAYHAHTAKIIDPYVDFLLVGDSLGMVMHGYETTLPVPLDLMIMHGAAVVRGSSRSLVVVDMPFGSYEESPAVAFRNAARVIKETGCGAVKLEGGRRLAETIAYLTQRGIPVMAHIGLTPQSVNVMGGFKTQGRRRSEWQAIEDDAAAVAEAGAFSVVLEGMAELLAARITKQISIPTIGIGASASCDGQILVLEDMLGLNPQVPKFVKKFAAIGDAIEDAVRSYADEVRSRAFPGADHVYGMRQEGSAAAGDGVTKKPKITRS